MKVRMEALTPQGLMVCPGAPDHFGDLRQGECLILGAWPEDRDIPAEELSGEDMLGCIAVAPLIRDPETVASYIKREEKAKKNGTWEDTLEYPDLTRAKEIQEKLHKMEDRLREKYHTDKNHDFTRATRNQVMTDPKDQQDYKELLQSYLREMNYLNHIMQVTANTKKIKKELHDWFSDGEQGHALQKAYEEYLSVQEQSLNILRYGVTLTEEEKSKGVTKGQVEEKNRLLLLEKENAFMKAYKAVAKGRMDAMIRDHFDGEHKGKPIRLDLNLKDMMSTITRVAKDNKAGMAAILLRTDSGLAKKLM